MLSLIGKVVLYGLAAIGAVGVGYVLLVIALDAFEHGGRWDGGRR